MESHDSAVQLAAFRFLEEQTQRHPDGLVPRAVLQQGFDFRGSRVPLVGPQGIFKPEAAQWLKRFGVRISDQERAVGSEDDFDSMFTAAALSIREPKAAFLGPPLFSSDLPCLIGK